MSTQRMPSKTSIFKLTVAVGLGLLGASGVALMSGGSTAEPFGIRAARADGPFVLGEPGGLGTNGEVIVRPIEHDFTWGNGITARQFRRYGQLLCSNDHPQLGPPKSAGRRLVVRKPGGSQNVQGYAASPVFATHMGEPDFRKWFTYVVRDGAPSGTAVGGPLPIPVWFKGEGGLTFSWLNTPLPVEKRSVVLGALSAFVNDNGSMSIVRACGSCSGNSDIIANPGPVSTKDSEKNPKIQPTSDKKDWFLELAFVGKCTAQRNAPPGPTVIVFWSETLKNVLNMHDKIGSHIQERMCTRAYDEQGADPGPCPFSVVDSMENACTMKQDKGMTCKVGGVDRDAAYTFIDPSVTPGKYRLPALVQSEGRKDLPRPQPEVTTPIKSQPGQVKSPKAR
ncbi:hypothetical protein [Sorangium sp. So ce1000]|uniref:hypothetical protein n=1 Tax=Sorangium sp. So ce1000 TaxID=3133325 RepID=UPI003F5E520F